MKHYSTKDGALILVSVAFVATAIVAIYAVDTVNLLLTAI
jgi:hypothetical protein